MISIDIESIIPHRAPIKIISEVIDAQEDSGIAAAKVTPAWPLFENGAVNSLVLIEAVAQTAAVIEGYKRIKQGKDSVKGWLVGIKSAKFNVDKIPVDTKLTIFVVSKYTMDSYAVVEGTVKSGENVLATMVLQALRLNEDDIKK
jgi:predicted hotdog family 3-hydroxylacyl-ACP dehydratase